MRRIATSLRLSGLPPGQTLGNFDFATLPHSLENAPRFPQSAGLRRRLEEEGGCTVLIVAAAQK
jgi:hypothetical protein